MTESLRESIARTLQEIGLSPEPSGEDSELHSWRCAYPPINGNCRCFDELVENLESVFHQHCTSDPQEKP